MSLGENWPALPLDAWRQTRLTTHSIPWKSGGFQIELDFIAHRLKALAWHP